MRILVYSYNYYPEPIGIAPLVTELAEGMVKRGHQVRVVTAMPWYPEGEIHPEYQGKYFATENIKGVEVQRCYVWSGKKRSLWNRAKFELSFVFFSLIQGLKGWRPDLIFLTIPGLPVCISAAILKLIYRCPIVLNVQDILPDAAVCLGLIKNSYLIIILKILEIFAYKIADKISVIADSFTNNIMAKGVAKEKIVEIPNWVDTKFIQPQSKPDSYFSQQHQLKDKFIVLYSGNIALTQGLETVIDAATYLQNIPDIAIIIAGESQALARLEHYCQEKKVNNVTLLPLQPRAKLPEMLAAADVGLVVQKKNVIHFNMPSKIQVLLASGSAIIASVPDKGTAANAIRQCGGGLITPPENPQALAETIIKLYRDRALTERLSRQGRLYAEQHYAFELALDKYEKLFLSVLQSSSSATSTMIKTLNIEH